MRKATIILIGLCVAGVIALWIYFVAGVSGTSKPIKTYDFSGNLDTLMKRLNDMTQVNNALSFKPTDTTGTEEKGYNYYFTLHWVTPHLDTIEYCINLSNTKSNSDKSKAAIELVEAINLTKLSGGHPYLAGGYTSTAKGIQPLVDLFDANILPHLAHGKR